MSTNAAKLIQLEAGKSALEKAPKPTPRAQPDVVEEFAGRLTPTSAAWVRSHPEYVRDPKKNRAMLAAHELAMANDLKPDSEEYFSAIERTLGLSEPNRTANGSGHEVDIDEDPTAHAAKPTPETRRTAPPSAPVSRGGGGQGSRQNVVTLSPQEVEIAELMFPDSKNPSADYARNKILLKKEGKLN
jgi:hypothetical protein